MERIACKGCGKLMGNDSIAAFRGGESPMGDEWSTTCYRCQGCGQYTVEHWDEKFLADDVIELEGPYGPEEGEAIVRQMKDRPASDGE